jgi:hypothetical protein
MPRDRRQSRRPQPLGSERLESRQLLAIDLGSTLASGGATAVAEALAAYALAPARIAAPSASEFTLAAPAATGADAVTITLASQPDPLYGDEFVLAANQRSFGIEIRQQGRQFVGSIDVGAIDLPLASSLQLQVLSPLLYWNGTGQPQFAPARGGVQLNLSTVGQDLRIGQFSDLGGGPRGGIVRRTIDVGVSEGQPLRRRIDFSIGSGGRTEIFAKPGAPAGIYAFTGMWSAPGARGVRDSAPVAFVLRVGSVRAGAVAEAKAFFSAAATRPAAITAVAVEPGRDLLGRDLMIVNLQFSEPVTSSGRSPQLPIMFDGVERLATLDRDANRTDATTLRFVHILGRGDRLATDVRLGNSYRVPTGGVVRASAGGAAVRSLPPEFLGSLAITFAERFAVVASDIVRNTTFRQGTTYVIDAEVHVRAGVTLTIEDGVTVLIRNGRIQGPTLTSRALIFDTGSRLVAKTVSFGAADDANRPVAQADNGGLFFLGSLQNATKDGISVVLGPGTRPSSFRADSIVASHLGRTDPFGGDGDDEDRDDIDAISLLGLGLSEWQVKSITSESSGDDGFDVTNSAIAMERLVVVNPVEDGLNISSSFVQIRRALTVVMSGSRRIDRELFDLETAAGPARVAISRLADVDLRGYWGDRHDEVNLSSPDMPRPSPSPNPFGGAWYEFTGRLRRGPAIIYSLTAD